MRARGKIGRVDAAACTVVRRERIGRILAAQGKLDLAGFEQVIRLQQARRLRFGEAALRLQLITLEDLREALAKQYDYPYLPPGGDDFSPDLAVSRDARHPQAEQFRALRTQLLVRWSNIPREPRALAIVSPGPLEGRSFVAANLAVLFAQLGLRTLVLDSAPRPPRPLRIL